MSLKDEKNWRFASWMHANRNYEFSTFVLVLHYNFAKDQEAKMIRQTRNEADVANLKKHFAPFRNCRFVDLESLEHTLISQQLGQEGIRKLFSADKHPDLFILFVLSHGDKDGRILTDSKTEPPYDFFTTFQVCQALKENHFLDDSLKLLFFGPCRGEAEELRLPPEKDKEMVEFWPNSTRVLSQPSQHNFAIFFASIESTTSFGQDSGTRIVSAFLIVGNSLLEDVELQEYLRRMAKKINSCAQTSSAQTAQFSIFAQKQKLILHKNCESFEKVRRDGKGNLSRVVPPEKEGFFTWKSECKDLLFNRGRAVVFARAKDENVAKVTEILGTLEYEPQFLELAHLKSCLENISENGLLETEGSLFVVVVAPLEERQRNAECSEWAVDMGRASIPIGTLTQNLVASKCPTFAGRPKIFIFVNTEIRPDLAINSPVVLKRADVETANCHSGFIVGIFSDFEKVVEALKTPGLVEETISLQKVLVEALSSHSDQLWSTTEEKVGFPKCKTKYIRPLLQREGVKTNAEISLDDLVDEIIDPSGKSVYLIHASAGMGKSSASREIHSMLVIKLENHLILHSALIKKKSQMIRAQNFDSLQLEEQLKLIFDLERGQISRFKENLQERRVFLILDGFDEISVSCGQKLTGFVKKMTSKGARILLTSRSHEKKELTLYFPELCSFKLLNLKNKQVTQFLQTRLNVDKEECKNILSVKILQDFLSIPIHLEMYCELTKLKDESVQRIESNKISIFRLYQKFTRRKIELGITARKNLNFEDHAEDFTKLRDSILKLLREISTSELQDKQVCLQTKDRELINMSGIAAISNDNQVEYVHRTFGEFLRADDVLNQIFSNSKELQNIADLILKGGVDFLENFLM